MLHSIFKSKDMIPELHRDMILDFDDRVKLMARLNSARVPIPDYDVNDIDIKVEYTVTCTLIYIIDMFSRKNLNFLVFDVDNESFKLIE